MEIMELKGEKIICSNLSGGYKSDQEHASKYLQIGKEYSVDGIDVDAFFTQVYLKEFPNIPFNSVFFSNVPQEGEYFISYDDGFKKDLPTYCLMKKIDGAYEVIITKSMYSKKEFQQEVENLTKYFNATQIK